MSETARINVRVNKELKNEAEKIFKQMGMSMTTAVSIFLAQCVREKRLPFQPGATQAEVDENRFNELIDEASQILGSENIPQDLVSFEELEIGEE